MENIVELLINVSKIMSDKMELCKKALLYDIVPNLNYTARIGIRAFTATGVVYE
jgi:hypothetical protein